HHEFADTTFENADFEIAGSEGTGGEVMPEGWTSSNLYNMRSRSNAGTLEIDFFYRSSRLTGDAPTSNWWAFQEGEEVTTDQAAGALVFEAQVMPRIEGQGFNPFGTIHHPRALPVAVEVGQYFWDAD